MCKSKTTLDELYWKYNHSSHSTEYEVIWLIKYYLPLKKKYNSNLKKFIHHKNVDSEYESIWHDHGLDKLQFEEIEYICKAGISKTVSASLVNMGLI